MSGAVNLLALCGLNPQVVTETMWALLRDGYSIKTVSIITTDIGKRLFDIKITNVDNSLENLWSMFNHKAISPDEFKFHIIKNEQNENIIDILSKEDHLAATKLIGEKVWLMTRDKEPALHASVAGGRKTMGVILSTAMSLFARPQDCLSHVLVSPDIEKNTEFLYPNTKSINGHSYIHLLNIPFPRLSPLIQNMPLPNSMEKLIEQLDDRLSDVDVVTLNIKNRQLIVRDKIVRLSPLIAAVYLLFVRHRQEDENGIEPRYLDVDFIAKCYSDVGVDKNKIVKLTKKLDSEIVHLWLLEKISCLKRVLNDALGPNLAQEVGIESVGKRPRTRYRLRMPSWRVKILF